MKKIVLHLGVLFSILLGIKWMVEKSMQTSDLDYYFAIRSKKDANLIFVGTSRTQYGIIPGLFDSVMKQKTASINYGLYGTLPPKNISNIEQIIMADSSIKYLLIELSDGYKPLQAFDWQQTLANAPAKNFKQQLNRWESSANNLLIEWLAIRQSKHTEQTAINFNQPLALLNEKGDVARRQPKLSTAALAQFYQLSQHLQADSTGSNDRRRQYVKRLKQIIDFCYRKKITLLFFVPPRLLSESEKITISYLLAAIPPALILGADAGNKTYFLPTHSVDNWHLNVQGARLFTMSIAKAFQEQVLKQ